MSNTSYWDNTGKHQTLYTKVSRLIPDVGEVQDGRTTNKHLEKLRRAANCYYDLFNNGLCNRAAEFRQVFGFGGTVIVKNHFARDARLEDAMDKFILAAAAEQSVVLEGYEEAVRQLENHGSTIARERWMGQSLRVRSAF